MTNEIELLPRQIASTVLVNDKNEVLIMKRSRRVSTWPGTWNFPGGSVDEGETKREAAIRELEEEAGIIADPSSLISLGVLTTNDNKDINFFLCKEFDGEVDINWESSDFRWVTLDKIEEYDFVGGGSIHPAVLDDIKENIIG